MYIQQERVIEICSCLYMYMHVVQMVLCAHIWDRLGHIWDRLGHIWDRLGRQ